MKKNIVILGGRRQQIPAISRAHYLGYNVILPDYLPDVPGYKMAKYPLPNLSTHNSESIIKKLKELSKNNINISGIIAIAVEASHTVAKVGSEFGLKAISLETALKSRNKLERLKCWKAAGVPCPEFGSAKNLKEAINISERIGYPVVFKPVDLGGAKGIVIINDKKQAEKFFQYTFAYSKLNILIEEYIDGTEHSSESIVHNGTIYTTGFSDRNYDTKFLYPPYLLENGDTTPTTLDKKVYKNCIEAVESAIKALGIDIGVAKGDIIVTKDGSPKMLEMAARVSGDYFASHTTPLNNGTDLISALIQQAVGDEINLDFLKWKYNRGVALRYCWPKPGRIIEINGFEEAKSLPGVKFIKWEQYWEDKNIGINTIITKPTSHEERVASVLTSSETREEAVKLANYVTNKIKIVTQA